MQAETFRSKVDAWLILVVGVSEAIVLVVVGAAMLDGELSPIGAVAIVLVSAAVPVWLLATTRYELTRDSLVVRSGPLCWNVAIASITSISPTRNPLSSPALSLDRLRIEYGDGRKLMISPRHKDAFLRALEARRRAAA